MTIPAAPPVPDRTVPEEEFDPAFEAFNRWQADDLVPGINALAANVADNTADAAQSAADALTYRNQAAVHATNAGASADAAAASAADLASLDALWLGAQPTDPATGQDGAPLVAGNAYVNTGSGYLRAYNGTEWVQGIAAVAGVSSVNGASGPVELPKLLAYADRGDLRANESWAHALVDGLGWFQWVSGSDEPDDDESCFATAAGRWLLQAPHWDLVDAWRAPDADASAGALEDLSGKVIRTSFTNTVTSVSAYSITTQTVFVPGATVGDLALLSYDKPTNTPPGVAWAYVSSVNSVSVHCAAPQGAAAYFDAVNPWQISIIK